jgi:hypothetical protein
VDDEEAVDSVDATWASLAKWNDKSLLALNATTGSFSERFQLFDPREPSETSDDHTSPTYRFVVAAEDVPDQKEDKGRLSEKLLDFIFKQEEFTPEEEIPPPDLQLDLLDEEDPEIIETSEPVHIVSGKVESFSGEVKTLRFVLSEQEQGGPEGEERNGNGDPRILRYDPEELSLEGEFSAAIVLVSDWDGDGVVDWEGEEEKIRNVLEVEACDVRGNCVPESVKPVLEFLFSPPTTEDTPPGVELLEVLPEPDTDGEVLLPFGEELRVRARAADDRGQPSFSFWTCDCEPDENNDCLSGEPRINADRWSCTEQGSGDLNAGGEFRQDPWEWIRIKPPELETQESIAVLRATEKIQQGEKEEDRTFTAVEIRLVPESAEGGRRVSFSLQETQGPAVALSSPQHGTVIDRDGLIVEAVILARISQLNQIKLLVNGKEQGNLIEYDGITGTFIWDLQDSVEEGDRICVGAVSVTGHATLNLLEFADTSEGLLVSVTVTTDLQQCEQVS